MAEAETTEPESSELSRQPAEEPKLGKSPDSRVLAPVDSNKTVESNGTSSGGADTGYHGNKSVFGSTSFGAGPAVSPGQGGFAGVASSSSSFGATGSGHCNWQASYRPPTVFGGSASSQGNPFAEITSMKQPGVSRTGTTRTSQPSEALIAPGRLNTSTFSRKNAASDTESDEDRNQRPVSSSILAPPRIVVGEKRENPLSAPKFCLRPSALAGNSDKDSSPANPLLKPATLKAPSENAAEPEEPSTSEASSTVDAAGASNTSDDGPHPDSSNGVATSSRLPASPANPPDSTESVQNRLSAPNSDRNVNVESSSDGFVFGTKLADRVTGVSSSAISSSTPTFGSSVAGGVTANSGDGFVFGQNLADRVVNAEKSDMAETAEAPDTPSSTTTDKTPTEKTLEESAREYQAKHETRPELEEVEVKTGEEEESNVLQANCKLFVFENPTQTWVERGRGQLRVNDMAPVHTESFHSRLVMRTHGSLRLILNTKIWAGMTVERASSKSIRITASDGEEGIKVFLISATPKDSENILSAIDWRVQRLQQLEEKSRSPTSSKVTEKRKADCLELDALPKKQNFK